MPSYLETIYFTEEYGPDCYPQKLCNHIYENYYKSALIPNTEQQPRLLDIGSGKGNHLVGFSRCGIESFGIDKRDECIKILKDFDIRPCDLEKDQFPFEDNYFDFIFTKSVLEHVYNTENFLRESLRVLRPGGVAVMMTPDWRSQMKHFWDDYTHVHAFTRKGLQNAMKINGFAKVQCNFFYQLPFAWKTSAVVPILQLIAMLPDSLKWKDRQESRHRKLIRFAKEKMLIGIGTKKP